MRSCLEDIDGLVKVRREPEELSPRVVAPADTFGRHRDGHHESEGRLAKNICRSGVCLGKSTCFGLFARVPCAKAQTACVC
eukprot:COSAG06_NODE_28314_length_576_cov_2.603774_1_plen_81_part_00